MPISTSRGNSLLAALRDVLPFQHDASKLSFLLFPLDLLVLYLAFVCGLKVRLGTWAFWPAELGYASSLVVVVSLYAFALILSGLYRSPVLASLRAKVVRAGIGMGAAWALSIALLFLFRPLVHIPPRSVTVIHCLLAIGGVLGLRFLLRELYGSERSALPSAPTLELTDVLPRQPVQVDTDSLRHYLSDRTVLVTGAGGSIGTELANQLVSLEPFRIVAVDVSEYNLFQLENALRQTRFDGELEFCIADVRDEAITGELFEQFRPDLVLHAAAYKHVPLMERHPIEAFRNNTLATINLMRLSKHYDVEQFVFVSTDKAVEPTSVLGATKRLAEWYVQFADMPLQRKIVRFGNVFGSQGSVVPLFREQLDADGTARVTHPDMERYFMSAQEACGLILQTLLLEDAPIYIFDMGDPVRIQDIAATMAERMFPQDAPQDHIEFVGKRPGEKLHEQLFNPEETVRSTSHPSILSLCGPVPGSRSSLARHLDTLRDLCQYQHAAELRKALFKADFEDATLREVG